MHETGQPHGGEGKYSRPPAGQKALLYSCLSNQRTGSQRITGPARRSIVGPESPARGWIVGPEKESAPAVQPRPILLLTGLLEALDIARRHALRIEADRRRVGLEEPAHVDGGGQFFEAFFFNVIEVREKSRAVVRINEALDGVMRRGIPSWVELERDAFKGTVKTLPIRAEMTTPAFQEQLIVELYSK